MSALEKFKKVIAFLSADNCEHMGHHIIYEKCDVCSMLVHLRDNHGDDPAVLEYIPTQLMKPEIYDYYSNSGHFTTERAKTLPMDIPELEEEHEEMLIRGEPHIANPRCDDNHPGYRWVLTLSLGIHNHVFAAPMLAAILRGMTPGSYGHFNTARELRRHECDAQRDFKIILWKQG